MASSNRLPGGTMGFLLGEFPVLSGAAENFIRSHPWEARAAVAAALEAVATQRKVEDIVEVPERLRPFVVRRNAEEEILGVSEAAARLAVSRTTVYEWARTARLIAWKTTKRGLRIPAGQILDEGRVVPGLKDVVDVIGDPELAWAFLTQEWAFEKMVVMPLDLLKAGRIDEVLDAAPGFGATFT
ncbi:MAG: helix-turn-helix domain-containing protein [Rhodobacteraceae bacterium]|nr:helix-turn-helix domain-containing protein [Paracoccaceae bacterium]